jgi:hypothetical protein
VFKVYFFINTLVSKSFFLTKKHHSIINAFALGAYPCPSLRSGLFLLRLFVPQAQAMQATFRGSLALGPACGGSAA